MTSYLALLLLFSIFALIAYKFASLESNKIFSSRDLPQLEALKAYLLANNIKAYIKNNLTHNPYPFSITSMADPSLHVVNVKDKEQAINLLKNYHTASEK